MDEALPTRPAGFWIRALALAIDGVVMAFVHASFVRLARLVSGPGDGVPGAVLLFTLLFGLAYTTTLHSLTGQTIGKSLTGVRVVALDGTSLTVGPALLRHLAYFLSAMPLGFGFLMAGLRRDKRALHDLIAGSRVERSVSRRRLARRPVVPARPPSGTLQEPAVSHSPDPERA
jgi:uncharacterized RDD family membrane protein YckC